MDSILNSSQNQPFARSDRSESAGDLEWMERTLTSAMRRLMDTENLDMPLLQLPLAQMRLALSLYTDADNIANGETMGRLSDRLRVRQNALTQAADRLVNHGLAERLSDPSDRRIVRLRLTLKGDAWVKERIERRRARVQLLWTLLNPQERLELLSAVRVLEAAGNRLPASDGASAARIPESKSEPPTAEHYAALAAEGETLIHSEL